MKNDEMTVRTQTDCFDDTTVVEVGWYYAKGVIQ